MEWIIALFSAFWIGILTAISPCPLATNIAAISYISKNAKHRGKVLFTGILYTLGRVVAYMLVAFIVAKSIVSLSAFSFFLQTKMSLFIGPLLIVVGMFMLELLSFRLPRIPGNFEERLKDSGTWGAFPLGLIFALSFCPVSAALFFGSLIPLSTRFSSPFIFASAYGIGTGIPVFFFSILIALGVEWMAKGFTRVQKLEFLIRMLTGSLIILVGIYLTFSNIFLSL